jgi:Ser/Thr protein kinase RdoA (MazF antagonist)
VPLAHLENTTFRVETAGGERYVLRIHRTNGSPFHPPRSAAEVRSEAIWLAALRRETSLAYPRPSRRSHTTSQCSAVGILPPISN